MATAPRIEREFFITDAAYRFARKCADDFDPANDWRDHCEWHANYDIEAELVAGGCDPHLVGIEAEAVRGLA